MEWSVFIDREDWKKIEHEEMNLFVRGYLEEMGVPLDEVWPDIELTTEGKLQLRELLAKLDIEILDDDDRGTQIWTKDIKLAQWFKPRYIMREDKGARNPAKRFYYEMVIKTWTMQEEQEKT